MLNIHGRYRCAHQCMCGCHRKAFSGQAAGGGDGTLYDKAIDHSTVHSRYSTTKDSLHIEFAQSINPLYTGGGFHVR